MFIGKVLKHIRIFNQLKQYDVAEELKLSKSYISEIESGNKIPTLEVLHKYSDYFDIPLSTILLFVEKIDKPQSITKRLLCKNAVKFLDWIVKNSKYNEE